MDWLAENMPWMRDAFWIVFTLAATIVSIKTYARAKSTVLQPLRTEVIRRQTDLIVDLLSFLVDKKNDFLTKIDYIGLVQANVLLTMSVAGQDKIPTSGQTFSPLSDRTVPTLEQ